jgi:pimeloyl-ACP methyl ester carboxylesterase
MLYFKQHLHPESSEWIVFIHGAGGSSVVWHKQLRDFRKEFNLLLIDLRGHGKSAELPKEIWNNQYTFDLITRDILEVLDHLETPPAHFMGVSLGTILARQLAELEPQRVKSLVMAGAVTRLTFPSRILVVLGNVFKQVIPYMWLYRLFAFIVMPLRGHSESRNLFVQEAQKLCQKEFIRWFKLTKDINPLLNYFKEKDIGIPSLYIMGDQDVMFLEPVKNLVKLQPSSFLQVLDNCGHVVNVEKPDEFNLLSIAFIKNLNLSTSTIQ